MFKLLNYGHKPNDSSPRTSERAQPMKSWSISPGITTIQFWPPKSHITQMLRFKGYRVNLLRRKAQIDSTTSVHALDFSSDRVNEAYVLRPAPRFLQAHSKQPVSLLAP